MYESLADRDAAPAEQLDRFVMQTVWCLFAEDLEMLQGRPLQLTVQLLLGAPTQNLILGKSTAAVIRQP